MTSTRERVYKAIRQNIAELGYSPSIRELCEAVNVASTSTIYWHLQNLAAKGRIVLPPKHTNRAITLPPLDGGLCAACRGTGKH